MAKPLKVRPDRKVPRQHARRHGITMSKFGEIRRELASVEGQGLGLDFRVLASAHDH
jgi:hypothetical protein